MNTENKQPDSIEVSAMAVVLCNGKLLVTTEDIYGNLRLSLPKGHQEQGETLIETAIRECFEETNVVITPADMQRQLTAFSYEFLTPSNKFVRKTIVPFLFEIADFGTPIPKEKRVISVQWMNIADFLQNCSYQNVKTVVEEI